MRRRRLLQSMLALSATGVLSSCRRHEPAAKGTLRLILHGPFGVVTIRRGDEHRIHAFVPFDPKKQHEFRFRTPRNRVAAESDGKRYRFELGQEGLAVGNRQPYHDHGFDDFNLGHIGEWRPEPEKYFVYLDLPAPDVITYIPPAEAVQFQDGRTGIMPLDQILEYPMRDANDVRIHSKELGDQTPMTCSDLVQEFRNHWQSPEHKQETPSERPNIESDLVQCSNVDASTFFFGVGLPEKDYTDQQLESLGRDFFNQVLLKSFPRSPRTERLEIAHALGYSLPCQPSSQSSSAAGSSPTVYRDWLPQPRLRMVSASEDCKYGGLHGTSP